MAKKAWYGALMGVGQGVSTYGAALTTDALREQADDRIINRQHSLAQIRQQFDLKMQADRQQFQMDTRDEKRTYDEDRELELLNPDSELYQKNEAERARLAAEKQANAVELRSTAYGGSGGASGIMGNLNQSQWTQESFQTFMSEVNRLQADEGLSAEEAYQRASGTTPLVPKPGASSADTANTNKIMNASIDAFMQQDKASMVFMLEEWFPGEDLSTLTKRQLLDKYKEVQGFAFPGGGGLMNPQPQGMINPQPQGGGLGNDPLGLNMSG